MLRIIAHAGVEHVTESEAASHASNVPTILLLSGIALAAGIGIYWLLTPNNDTDKREEDES